MKDFIRIPSNPVPPGAEAAEITGADGAKLRAAFFPVENARGTVLLVTGWAEFIEKYFETVGDLHTRRLNVAMMDWRGQGLSDQESPGLSGWRGYFDMLRRDLHAFAEAHVKPRFAGPAILMTHSMGGMPGLMLLAAGYEGFARAVLCAPMTRLFKPPVNAVMGAAADAACAVGWANKNVMRGKDPSEEFDGNIFTSDRLRHARFRALKAAEPGAAPAAPTYGWVRAAMAASRKLHGRGFFRDLKTPTRIVSAGAEQQIDGSDHANIAAASDLIDVATIPGALHEIMMERDEIRERYWAAFDEFVERLF